MKRKTIAEILESEAGQNSIDFAKGYKTALNRVYNILMKTDVSKEDLMDGIEDYFSRTKPQSQGKPL
ncbi:MAG: hypothetical protein QXN71_01425 [Candidatus Aenigmatarchaeota archaeon]